MPRIPLIPFAILTLLTPHIARADPPDKKYPQRTIPTLHYDLRTDVSNEIAAEAYVRMDRMFEEYNDRTSSFAKPLQGRFLFQLFATQSEYEAAGGLKDSLGIFVALGPSSTLLGVAGKDPEQTWHVIQHEGFHLFAYAQITATLAPWINEGIAECYGAALFTGDGYLDGIADKTRIASLLTRAKANTIVPFPKFRLIDYAAWDAKPSNANYDQAWSMAHFLLHGDNNKYIPSFNRYMTLLSKGADGEAAWHAVFGPDNGTFERAWFAYYQNLDVAAANQPLLEQAANATVASFLLRAKSSGLPVTSVDDLLQLEKSHKLLFKPDAEHWLPTSLLDQRLAAVGSPVWTVTWTGPLPTVKSLFPDGGAATTTFTQQNKTWRTKTLLTAQPKPAPATVPAR